MPYQIPYGYYNYYYGYSYMIPAGNYYQSQYSYSPSSYSPPKPNYRDHNTEKYAKEYYSHLNIVNSPDTVIDYKNARFFVVKSFIEENVHKSMKYQVWSSTPEGNKRLNAGYVNCESQNIPLILLFSVNGSKQFVGVARMTSPVNFTERFAHWEQDGKWLGKFSVEWIFVKDVPNREFKTILVPTNENKPITNTKDAQEVPFAQGMAALKIFKDYKAETSMLDAFEYYDKEERKRNEAKTQDSFARPSYDSRGKGKKDKGYKPRPKEEKEKTQKQPTEDKAPSSH